MWENTNKLLGTVEGFIGCKTGITEVAGPCFSGVYDAKGDKICVVVLNCRSMDQRWVEVPQMVEWAVKKKFTAVSAVAPKHFNFCQFDSGSAQSSKNLMAMVAKRNPNSTIISPPNNVVCK
jgi:D-alanyl-D-alanine carboxypeptidase